jgi:hypothetical protein
MKGTRLIFLAAVLTLSVILSITAFSGTRTTNQNTQETPRMKCLKSCQTTHNSCLAGAKDSNGKSDPAKASACNKALSDCIKVCPQN